MKVDYEFEESSKGTLARIRVRDEAGGCAKLTGPMLTRGVKRNITNEPKALKKLLQSQSGEGP